MQFELLYMTSWRHIFDALSRLVYGFNIAKTLKLPGVVARVINHIIITNCMILCSACLLMVINENFAKSCIYI